MTRLVSALSFGGVFFVLYYFLGFVRHPALGGFYFSIMVGVLGAFHFALGPVFAIGKLGKSDLQVLLWIERAMLVAFVPPLVYATIIWNEPILATLSWSQFALVPIVFSAGTYAFVALTLSYLILDFGMQLRSKD